MYAAACASVLRRCQSPFVSHLVLLSDAVRSAVANKASLSKPAELNPPAAKQEEFAKKFGITWKAALDQGLVFNAVDGCKRLGIDGEKMDKTWVRRSLPRPAYLVGP